MFPEFVVNILQTSLHAMDQPKIAGMEKALEWAEKTNKTTPRDQESIWINPIHGRMYQLKLLMLLLHRGLSHKYSFRISTEIKEAEKFYDLVFEYVHDDKKFYRLMQVKYKFDESKKITVNELLADLEGDYSLVKYFYSFQACKKDNLFKDGVIKDVIICTNIDFDSDDLKNFDIEIEEIDERDDILDITSNEKESTRYKFTTSMIEKLKCNLEPSCSDDEIEYFLNHLIFAVNHPNEEELCQIIKREIGREMAFIDTDSAYNKLLVKIMNLSQGKRNSMFLSYQEGKKFFHDLKKEIAIWFNVQDPVVSFTGRLEYLEKVHEVLTKKFQLCISGMGGVGKTELVKKYIADFGNKYNKIVWINAGCYATICDSFRQLASDKLNISLNSPDGKEKHISSILTDVYQLLSKSKSLLIFDNAEKYKCKSEFDRGIDQFLPRLPDNCIKPNVIITSRNQKWPRSIETIVLQKFKADEAREFVEKMLNPESDEEKELIVELGEKLQLLPFALQLAIAFITIEKEKLAYIGGKFGISDYLKMYSKMAQKIMDFEFSEEDDSNYNKSVFTTWNITYDALKQNESGQDAVEILNIISYFLPENISVELLQIFSKDEEKLNPAIRLLKQYSIVSVQHKAISIHRLAQQVAKFKLQKQNDEVNVLQNALKLLNEDNINFKNVDHVISMWTFASKHGELLKNYVRVFRCITAKLLDYGRIEEADTVGFEVSELLNLLSPTNSDVQSGLLAVKYNAGMILVRKGEYQAALEQLKIAYEFERKIAGPSNTKSSVTSSIARVLVKLGRNAEALEYYYEVLDQKRADLGEAHPEILKIQHHISIILFEEGKHEEALAMGQRIYEVQKITLGDSHERTLSTKNHIASALGRMNRIEEALKILQEVCEDQEASLPKNHPEILATKFNIATAFAVQRKYTEALEIYEDLLVVQRESLGENHPEVIDISINVANILNEQGEHERASDILEGVFDKQKVILGPTHPATLNTQESVANVFMSLKKYENAMELYEDLLDKQLRVWGSSHPITLETRRSIVKILAEQKRYDVALERSLELIHNAENIYGKNHPETLNDKRNLSTLYCRTRQFKRSLEALMQVLAVQKSFLTQDHDDCQQTINHITLVLGERSKFGQNENIDSCLAQLKRLLKRDFDINAKDKGGRTMLHHALNVVDERKVEMLLQQGADVFVTSNKGETPLHVAVLRGRENFVKLLLGKVKPARLIDFVDAKTSSSGYTALHVAAEVGHFGIVKCLLKNHATFCSKSKNGKTPLNLATNPEITSFLKMIDELFEGVTQSDTTEIVQQLEGLASDELLAVTSTRNDQGSTLARVAITNKQRRVATEILQMVQKSNSN